MKRLFGAIAAAALLVSPLSAMAQGHGGMGGGHGGFGGGGGGGFRGAGAPGGWHGGGFHGGGWHGGGFHGGRYCCGFFPFYGFGLGLAASSFYYWGDPYWGWGPGYYGYSGYPYGYGGYPYDGYGDPYGGYPPNGYYGAPGPGAAPPAACGKWIWRADQSHYQWVAQPCAAPAQQAAPAEGY